jgi:hypothetical protein
MTYAPGYVPSADRAATTSSTNSLAVVSMVFGILSWCGLVFIGAIVAVVCGHLARSEIRRAQPGAIDGDGMALAGLVLGYAHLALILIGLVVVMGVLFLGAGLHWF